MPMMNAAAAALGNYGTVCRRHKGGEAARWR